MPKPKLIAIVGPTASGKTSLGIFLAQKVGGEIISADSRQVYKGLDIGTGKVTKKEMAGVPHHLLDVVSPKKQFTVDDFKKQGEKACSSILQNNRIPIIVGGTGLYIDTLLGRMAYAEVPPNIQLRERLEKKSVEQLFTQLQKVDPARATNIEPHNKRRIIRALEIAKALGKNPPKETAMNTGGVASGMYDILWIGLNPGEKKLKKNIRIRLLARIKAGMIREAQKLHKAGVTYKRMDELGLEYRYLAQVLQNKITKEQFEVELERAIVHYAKRQMRWFKRNKEIVWIKNKTEALKLSKNFVRAMKESNPQ